MGMFSTTLKFSWISTKGNVISLTAVNFSVPYCNILGWHLVSEGLRLDLIDTGLFVFFNVGFSSLFVFRKFFEAIAGKFHYSALFTTFRLAEWVNYFLGFFSLEWTSFSLSLLFPGSTIPFITKHGQQEYWACESIIESRWLMINSLTDWVISNLPSS